MKSIRGVVAIHTKFSDESNNNAAETICQWGDTNEVGITFGYGEDGKYICQYLKRGRTTAFCKGTAAELKDLIKTCFSAKITTLFEAW